MLDSLSPQSLKALTAWAIANSATQYGVSKSELETKSQTLPAFAEKVTKDVEQNNSIHNQLHDAVAQDLITAAKSGSDEEKENALALVLRFLAKALRRAGVHLDGDKAKGEEGTLEAEFNKRNGASFKKVADKWYATAKDVIKAFKESGGKLSSKNGIDWQTVAKDVLKLDSKILA